jgi:nitrogen fixation protein NifB
MPSSEKFLRTPELVELAKLHPCLGREANSKFGRVHLPVSPACNIQCRFCRRTVNKSEQRPGVTGCVLSPEEALEKVGEALELCPDITVVGIAGPGDTLATDAALETFRLVHEKYPKLIKCLSTNGLLLPEKGQALFEAGVRTVTVTVNAVDPEIQAKIISHINYHGVTYTGVEAAGILIEKQLEGIRLMSSLGAAVKINTVLIPGVNDSHIETIARTVSEAGAGIYNIIPLIPQHEFSDAPAPTCTELNDARVAAEKYLPVFRHCQHCRADACGIPGKGDLSSQLYKNAAPETFSHG